MDLLEFIERLEMGLGDCSKCWEAVCICGHSYKDWTQKRKQELRDALGPSPKEEDLQARLAKAEELNKVYESALEFYADMKLDFLGPKAVWDAVMSMDYGAKARSALAAKQLKE